MIMYDLFETELGHVLLAANAKGVCHIGISHDAQTLKDRFHTLYSGHKISNGGIGTEMYTPQLKDFLSGNTTKMHFPIDEQGTDFQKSVWAALRRVPYGQTISYSELAAMAGSPRAVRAVASACGANPLAIYTPCHRIIHKDGSMSGYFWGIAMKEKLLALESANSNIRKAA